MSSEKTKELMQQLNDGIRNLCRSDKWQDYLNFVSKFPNYSYYNTLLIYYQRPTASYVRGFKAWNQLNGHVQKGSKAIKILAPHVIKDKSKTDDTDDAKEEKKHIGFHVAYVYDIADVDGVSVPDEPCRILDSTVDNYDYLVEKIISISPCPVSFAPINGSANGYFSPSDDKIVVKSGLSQSQSIKTLIHEITHSILHCKGGNDEAISRDEKEIEAESVAYIVCQRIGIDSGDYSYGYIAGWSGIEQEAEQKLDKIKNLMKTISETADYIYDMIDTAA